MFEILFDIIFFYQKTWNKESIITLPVINPAWILLKIDNHTIKILGNKQYKKIETSITISYEKQDVILMKPKILKDVADFDIPLDMIEDIWMLVTLLLYNHSFDYLISILFVFCWCVF